MDKEELLIMMESPDIKEITKTINGMVREFIIGQMEINMMETGRIIKEMGMLYFILRMEQSIERSGTMIRRLSQF
jgi:hypothetical protein